MLNRILLTAIIGASLLQQACTDKDNSEPPAPLTKIDQPLYLVVDWRTDTGAGIENASYNMQPLMIQDQIFSIDTEGVVQSINAKNGRVTWIAFTGLPAITGLSGQDGVLIASSRNGDLNAYDILENNLRQRWSIRLNGEIRAVPVISDEQVFVRRCGKTEQVS